MTNVIVYHIYNRDLGIFQVGEKPNTFSKVLLTMAKTLGVAGILIFFMIFAPYTLAWAKNDFSLSQSEVTNITQSQENVRSTYQPAFDPRLPKDNRLIIPSIGVKTEIQEATLDNYEPALKMGVWRVSDFGAPSANSMPTILAAHRYGYLAWSDLFRRQNSFFNLPKLKVGDTVEINWRQRKYVYEIYAADEGTSISDYSADLILYTCVSLTGEQRIFRYARLIDG